MTFLAELREGTRISLEAIRGNMLRSVLTTLGVVIGIVTVTLMAMALEGLNGAFREAISFMGTDVLHVSDREWFIDNQQRWDAAQKRRKISILDARAVQREMTTTSAVAPVVMHSVPFVQRGSHSSSQVRLVGTNEQFLLTGAITLTSGRFMTALEAQTNRDLCIIGYDVAEHLFQSESPLGQRIRIGDESMEVIGVLEKRGSVLGQMSLDNQVIIPLGKMLTAFRWDPNCVIQVKAGSPEQLDETREELRGILRKIRKVPPDKPDDFAINQQQQLLDRFTKVSGVIGVSGFFITGLSLFVGGIGIMNIMFVSVAERTREIGIRKAIGARRRTILLQFLIEAAVICLIGGTIAILIAAGAMQIARQFLPQVGLSPMVVTIALGVALGTGLISGFLPAWRAARMSPVDALRND